MSKEQHKRWRTKIARRKIRANTKNQSLGVNGELISLVAGNYGARTRTIQKLDAERQQRTISAECEVVKRRSTRSLWTRVGTKLRLTYRGQQWRGATIGSLWTATIALMAIRPAAGGLALAGLIPASGLSAARTVYAMLGLYPARLYGALGVGTDDTTALQNANAAATAAGGGTVKLRVGVFLLASAIVLGSCVTLEGTSASYNDDTKGTVLKATSAGAFAGTPIINVSDNRYGVIRKLSIEGAGAATSNTTQGISDFADTSKQASYLLIEWVMFRNLGGTRIGLYGNENHIFHNSGRSNAGHFIHLKNSQVLGGGSDSYVGWNDSGDCAGNATDAQIHGVVTADGSANLTAVTGLDNLGAAKAYVVGWSIEGTGIAAGTTITGVGSGTLILSAGMTAGVGVNVVAAPPTGCSGDAYLNEGGGTGIVFGNTWYNHRNGANLITDSGGDQVTILKYIGNRHEKNDVAGLNATTIYWLLGTGNGFFNNGGLFSSSTRAGINFGGASKDCNLGHSMIQNITVGATNGAGVPLPFPGTRNMNYGIECAGATRCDFSDTTIQNANIYGLHFPTANTRCKARAISIDFCGQHGANLVGQVQCRFELDISQAGQKTDNTYNAIQATTCASCMFDNCIAASGGGATKVKFAYRFEADCTTNHVNGGNIGGSFNTAPGVSDLGTGDTVRNVAGYIIGNVVVAVPATTVAVAAVGYDRTFYITANVAAQVSVTVSNGVTAFVIPLGQVGTVHVPAAQTLTPTFTAAPTWVCAGPAG